MGLKKWFWHSAFVDHFILEHIVVSERTKRAQQHYCRAERSVEQSAEYEVPQINMSDFKVHWLVHQCVVGLTLRHKTAFFRVSRLFEIFLLQEFKRIVSG